MHLLSCDVENSLEKDCLRTVKNVPVLKKIQYSIWAALAVGS
jgi:hypothetical protein